MVLNVFFFFFKTSIFTALQETFFLNLYRNSIRIKCVESSMLKSSVSLFSAWASKNVSIITDFCGFFDNITPKIGQFHDLFLFILVHKRFNKYLNLFQPFSTVEIDVYKTNIKKTHWKTPFEIFFREWSVFRIIDYLLFQLEVGKNISPFNYFRNFP